MRRWLLVPLIGLCWLTSQHPASAEASIEEHAYCAAYLDMAATRLQAMGDPFIANLRNAAAQHAQATSQDYRFVLHNRSNGGEFADIGNGARFQAEEDILAWQRSAAAHRTTNFETSAAGRGIRRCIDNLR